MTNIAEMFYQTVDRRGGGLAVCQHEVRLTWNELAGRAERLAGSLGSLGLKEADRVALYSENDFRFFEVAAGTALAGGVLVPINARLAVAEVAAIVQSTRPVVLLCDEELTPQVKAVRKRVPALKRAYSFKNGCLAGEYEGWIGANRHGASQTACPSGKNLAVVIFTSGTTGTPKGVMWSHEGVLDFAYRWPLAESCAGERQLIFVPTYVGAGGMLLYNALNLGTETHLIRFSPQEALEVIERERIGLVCGVTALYQFMADLPKARKYDMSSLDLLVYGARYMGAEQYDVLRDFFTCDFKQVFGMTECPHGASLSPEDHRLKNTDLRRARLRSAGKPVEGTDIRVVNENGEPVESDAKAVGEIIIKAKSIMMGYWEQPELTRSCIRDGFYWTNDMASVDPEGYIYVRDRKDYMIKSGGMNIFPAEVEAVILRHPAVAEVAVVGAPDPKWGKTVVAVVHAKPDAALSAEELTAHCKEHMAGYKKPTRIVFTAEPLPRTAMGKLNKKTLEAMLR